MNEAIQVLVAADIVTSDDAVCNDNVPNTDNNKKSRWTSSEKKARKQQRAITAAVQQQPAFDEHQPLKFSKKRIKKMNRIRAANETTPIHRLIASAQKVLYTGSVNFVNYSSNELLKAFDYDDTNTDSSTSSVNNKNNPTKIQVVTTCGSISSLVNKNNNNNVDTSLTIPQIHVKPLLVLDLNGILCHRIRPKKELPAVMPHRPEIFFRPVLAHIANTNIIARTGLHSFLDYLSKHFCLAICKLFFFRRCSILFVNCVEYTIY